LRYCRRCCEGSQWIAAARVILSGARTRAQSKDLAGK
jgi:hypothetical protein